jgi:hypothetical protein
MTFDSWMKLKAQVKLNITRNSHSQLPHQVVESNYQKMLLSNA